MASSAHTGHLAAPRRPAVADRLFRVTTPSPWTGHCQGQQYSEPGPSPQEHESFHLPAALCSLALSPVLFHT